jgi:heat shock protein HslJ
MLALLVVSLTAGCAAASFTVADREFLSTAVVDGGAALALAPGTRIRLTFQATDLGVSAGCNHIGGSYRIDGGRLVFEGVAMTDMGCDAQRDRQDQWLIAFLTSKPATAGRRARAPAPGQLARGRQDPSAILRRSVPA